MDKCSSVVYRVQLAPRLNDKGLPFDSFFDDSNPFDFDSNGDYFAFVTDFVKYRDMIHNHFSDIIFIKSVVLYDYVAKVIYED